MSLLSLSQVSFGYACGELLFDGATFSIDGGDRLAVVGPNGVGKSTLLGLLAGEGEPSGGQIVRRRGLRVAFGGQEAAAGGRQSLFDFAFGVVAGLAAWRDRLTALESQLSETAAATEYAGLIDEYQAAGGFRAEGEIERTLCGLGFRPDDWVRPLHSFSGGERMRAQLARTLGTPADLLILDEPTNHLDGAAREWLAEHLGSRAGACVIASHDRSLLTAFAARIVEIDRARLRVFEGGYQVYRRTRDLLDRQAWAAYEGFERRKAAVARAAQRREEVAARVAQAPEGIRGGKDHYARKAAKVARTARILRSRVDDQHRVEKPWEEQPIEGLSFEQVERSSDLVLVAEGLTKSYGTRTLFGDLTFHVRRGGRLIIRGPNGSGKTTLLNILGGSVPADGGSLRFGTRVTIASMAQDLAALDAGLSPLEICGSDASARTLLACLKLRPECLNRPLAGLSGGERTKVALARILNGGANLLLLDEPTNHLEIEAQEALEAALRLYPGALAAVSHDPFFIDALGPEVTFLDLPGTRKLPCERPADVY